MDGGHRNEFSGGSIGYLIQGGDISVTVNPAKEKPRGLLGPGPAVDARHSGSWSWVADTR